MSTLRLRSNITTANQSDSDFCQPIRMSGSWNNQPFQQSVPGQIKLFDPTQFQTPMSTPNTGSYSSPSAGAQTTETQPTSSTLQPGHNSWNSWGSWDWNGDNTDVGAGNNTGVGDASGIAQQQPPGAVPWSNDQQFYQADPNQQPLPHYNEAWNNRWDGAGVQQHQQQYQAYDQPGVSVGGNTDQSQQQHQYYSNHLQTSVASDQNQYANQHQFYNGQYYQQQPEQQHPEPATPQLFEPQQQQQQDTGLSNPQQQSYNQQYQEEEAHTSQYQQQQHMFHQQQNLSVDQGQQHQGYYDQPYDASNWNQAGLAEESAPGAMLQENNISSVSGAESVRENSASPENSSVHPSIAELSAPEATGHRLDPFDDQDNDGTVSGFFGKDDDGDMPVETSQRLGRGPEQIKSQPPIHQSSPIHQAVSDITNPSAASIGQFEEGDNDGNELQHIQELVQRMEQAHIAQTTGEMGEFPPPGLPPSSSIAFSPSAAPGLAETSSFSVASADHGQQHSNIQEAHVQHPGGDYSGFGSDVSEFMGSNKLSAGQASMPLDMDLQRTASPDGDEHAGSGGSGASGGSSGLTDWEIVPSQASSGPTHSRNSSLDNGVSSAAAPNFFSDNKPDGGLMSRNTSETAAPMLPATPDTLVHPDPSNNFESAVTGSGGIRAAVSSNPTTDTSSGSNVFQPPPQSDLQPPSSLPPPTATVSPPSLPLPPVGAEGSDNPFRRDVRKSPRQSSLPQTSNSSSTNSSILPPPSLPATSTSQHVEKPAGLTALPSRPKPSQLSSTEDGIPARRRDTDRPSEEDEQRRRHSAFHPVSRPRHTAPSPATTLWDQGDGSGSSNILLAPAVPLIIPNLNSYSTATSDSENSVSKQARDMARSKDDSRRSTRRDRKEEDPNRSIDSLDELDSSRELRDRSYREDPRERDERYRRDAERDRPSSRYDRPYSRTGGAYHYDRDRPSSRAEGYGRDDPYRRNRSYYRDYGDASYDERYDRPRSRHDESQGSRPTSRSGLQEPERPRSRANYDRDRDYYGRDRHRGYGYDGYGRHADYTYDERERYYRYYKEKEARYARGYYEEYYGANPDYYGRHGSRPASRSDYNRDYYHPRGYDYTGYYYDGYGYDPYAYGYNYAGYQDSYSQGYEQGRLTPPKYLYPHTRVCFGPGGQLVKVLPNRPTDGQPAVVELQDVQSLLQACPEAEELRRFPGPLTRANSHKKDVLVFCQQKARECGENVSLTDRESAQLIWRLLELLIKQNGSVVGTDLSDLLLEGHEPSTHEYALHGLRINQSPASLGGSGTGAGDEGDDTPPLRVSQERTLVNKTADSEREAWIDRFRHLLLYGRKKDALECAMKNNLWGHALFLASKMDSRTHANVMTRFANSAMRMNDPLQTLYQLMSNRQPAAVTCVGDERWGDWRPHLAMMLSNQTSRSDLDRKSICTLGDTLASKGYLHASHFCYLMAQVTLGTYFKKTSKVVLIGSSHTLPMDEFATIEAIQCTEVYEYAQLLGNPNFCLPHFQIYKYLYACHLADYGMAPEALHYCEVIASMIQLYPAWFKPAFVKLVHQLSSKLKYSDPQRLHTSQDAEDPAWMQQLTHIYAAFEDGSLQPMSGTVTPANLAGGGTTTSSESGDYGGAGAGYYGGGASAAPAAAAVVGGSVGWTSGADSSAGIDAYGQQQQQQVSTSGHHEGQQYYQTGGDTVEQAHQGEAPTEGQQEQHQHQQHLHGGDQTQMDYNQQQQEWNNYLQWQQQQQQQQQDPAATGLLSQYSQYQHHYHHQHQPHHQPQADNNSSSGSNYQHQLQQQHEAAVSGGAEVDKTSEITTEDVEDRSSSIGGGSTYDASSASSTLYGHGFGQQHTQHQPHYQLPPRASISTNETTDNEEVGDDDDDDDDDEVDGPASGFDYFGNVSAQKVVAPPHRYRSQSNSSSQGGGRRRRTTSGSSTGSVKAAPGRPAQHKEEQKKSTSAGLAANDKKPGQQSSSWFGGLWNKLGRKGNNEMILPEDTDPAIVWDPVKNKWVNSDGTEEEVHNAGPPPKDTELMGGKPPPSSLPPSSSSGLPPGPTSVSGNMAAPPSAASTAGGPNRFSRKATGGARNQYVDVNNPKPMAVPTNLFNVMPGAPSSGGSVPQVYMPGSAPVPDTGASNTNNNSSNNNQGLLSVPDVADQPPAPEPSAASSQPEVTTATTSQPMPQMPMLFNPANLSKGQGQPPTTGHGLKYGQRRAYPK